MSELIRRSGFPYGSFPRLRHAEWWRQALIAYEGAKAGLDKREIAILMFGKAAVDAGWMVKSDWMRSRVRRAIRIAEHLVRSDYHRILDPAWKRTAESP